jgi:ABC-2 type transport system permease protein
MTRWPAHLLNELHREWLMKKRYWFESVLGLGFIVTVFAGLLLAVVKVGGQPLEAGGADGLIVGFAVWLFALSASGSACQDVQEETSQRTLEQLCIAPLPLAGLLALRTALSLGFAVLMLLLALAGAQALTGGRLQGHWGLTLAACVLGAPALVGVGYALAGVFLLAKKAEMLQVITLPLVIALVALPAYPVNGLAALPYALAAATARASALGTVPSSTTWAWIALNAAFWGLLGGMVYRALEQRARRLGVLGHF